MFEKKNVRDVITTNTNVCRSIMSASVAEAQARPQAPILSLRQASPIKNADSPERFK